MKKTGLLIIAMFALATLQAQTLTIQGGTTFSRLNWHTDGTLHSERYEKTLIGYSGFVGVDYEAKRVRDMRSVSFLGAGRRCITMK
jgi:hypothetical protein